MKEKLYCDDGETAYPISWWLDRATDEQAIVEVELQKSDIKGGDLWCKYHGEFVEPGCNDGCDGYEPRNKVSGRCRSSVHGLTGTGIWYEVHPDGTIKKREPETVGGEDERH